MAPALLSAYAWLAARPVPASIRYGVSFNVPYAQELGLDWRAAYRAVLDDLGASRVRLAAHWPLVMPAEGEYDFSALDYQMEEARRRGVSVILAVGKRLPRWPECHVPRWARGKSWEAQKEILRAYIKEVVVRYRKYENLRMWQVENEPFLTVFASAQCGALDTAFLEEEIALVKALDPSRPVLLTDSGNLGLWAGAYQRGDAFGTSVYVYLWNPQTGPFRTFLPPSWYRAKLSLMELWYGKKDTLLIELSAEPWLWAPVPHVPLPVQLRLMNEEKMEEVVRYARETRLPEQYLWGAEWWYWLKETQGYAGMWERARALFAEEGGGLRPAAPRVVP